MVPICAAGVVKRVVWLSVGSQSGKGVELVIIEGSAEVRVEWCAGAVKGNVLAGDGSEVNG
jgi:hypothetical protein